MIETIVTVVIACNNYNWQYSEKCMAPVQSMEIVDNGFQGYLESGVFWKQYYTDKNTMRFEMEDVCWDISSQGFKSYC